MSEVMSISRCRSLLVTQASGKVLSSNCVTSSSLGFPSHKFSGRVRHGVRTSPNCGVRSRRGGVRASVVAKDDSPSSSTQVVGAPRKAAEIAEEFYELVNQRDYVKVSSLFAVDCVYEDFTFPEPVKGREEILKFFEKVMTSMGPELKFKIDDITRDDSNAVGVIWHLEWKGKAFPFSRGCSFYRCEINSSGQRQIKFARDIVEPATKPGDLAMGAIKLVTGLLERFPSLVDRI